MTVVLVTGGSSGIGLATVRRLAAAGHQVFCGSRQPTRAALRGRPHRRPVIPRAAVRLSR